MISIKMQLDLETAEFLYDLVSKFKSRLETKKGFINAPLNRTEMLGLATRFIDTLGPALVQVYGVLELERQAQEEVNGKDAPPDENLPRQD